MLEQPKLLSLWDVGRMADDAMNAIRFYVLLLNLRLFRVFSYRKGGG